MGHGDVEIVVAETGWPYKGDDNEVGPSVQNAKAYNGNLIAHLRSMVGTPLTPGKSVDTYFFALYDENLKPGPGSERAFGLFKPDLTMTYDVGLAKSASQVRVHHHERIYYLMCTFILVYIVQIQNMFDHYCRRFYYCRPPPRRPCPPRQRCPPHLRHPLQCPKRRRTHLLRRNQTKECGVCLRKECRRLSCRLT